MFGLTTFSKTNTSQFSYHDVPCNTRTQIRCVTTGYCIYKQYQCDGFKDCHDGSDESFRRCGTESPCDGKIMCMQNRCIPHSRCEGEIKDDCCPGRRLNINYEYPGNDNTLFLSKSQKNHYHSNWGYESAVFVVTGCTLAFISLLLLIIYAGSRYVLRKIAQRHQDHPTGGAMNAETYNGVLDQTGVSQRPRQLCGPEAQLLMHYETNNGIQILSRDPEVAFRSYPPPYSENNPNPIEIELSNYRPRLSNDDRYGDLEPPADASGAPPPYNELQSSKTDLRVIDNARNPEEVK